MLRIDPIMCAKQFIRFFRAVARHLARHRQPLLITQKNGQFIVVVDSAFFEEVMDPRARRQAGETDPHVNAPCDFKS
jgi:hypothetical protein